MADLNDQIAQTIHTNHSPNHRAEGTISCNHCVVSADAVLEELGWNDPGAFPHWWVCRCGADGPSHTTGTTESIASLK